jgi:hypothetical protein
MQNIIKNLNKAYLKGKINLPLNINQYNYLLSKSNVQLMLAVLNIDENTVRYIEWYYLDIENFINFLLFIKLINTDNLEFYTTILKRVIDKYNDLKDIFEYIHDFY